MLSVLLLLFCLCISGCRQPARPPTAESCYGLGPKWIEPKESTERKPGWKQNQIIVSYCCSAPPTETSIKNASRENFNMIPAWEQTLDYASKHGMKVMLEHGLLSPETVRSEVKLKELDGLIERIKGHPALEAYYIVDEPKANSFADLERMVAHLREKDPKHLAFVNVLPIIPAIKGEGKDSAVGAYQDYLRSYLKIVKPDLLSYDYYHFFRTKDGKPFDDTNFFLNLSLIRDAALSEGIPFLNIIQCSQFLDYWRMPNENELRWLVNTTLCYGGRGISYFLYWGPEKYRGLYRDGKPIALLEQVSKINKEILDLSPILMTLNSIGVYHSAPLPTGTEPIPTDFPVDLQSDHEFLVGLFSGSNRRTGIMIVNRNYTEAARVKVRSRAHNLQQYISANRSWRAVKTLEGVFSFTLPPGGTTLFEYKSKPVGSTEE